MTREEQFDSLLECWKRGEYVPLVDFIFEEGDEEIWIIDIKRDRRNTLAALISDEGEWSILFDLEEEDSSRGKDLTKMIAVKRSRLSRLDELLKEIEKNFATINDTPF